MIYSKHRFSLEIQCEHSQIAVPVKVGDTGVTFYIALTDGGKPFTIPDGTLAMLSIRRPTGTYLQEYCDISNNGTIIYDFQQNENTAAVEGIHRCDLTLYGSETGRIISTSWFTMIVSDKVVDGDSINVTDEKRDAIDAMIAAEASRQAKEAARVSAESARVDAEEERERAEIARQSAFDGTISEAGDMIDTMQALIDRGALDGKDGKDGYTPIKGVDYFTPSEINGIVELVLAQVPEVELYDGTVEVI